MVNEEEDSEAWDMEGGSAGWVRVERGVRLAVGMNIEKSAEDVRVLVADEWVKDYLWHLKKCQASTILVRLYFEEQTNWS